MPKDEGVIRYLMKEMDPSEEIEFERSMMEDENLLIEVECLRKTLEKTKKLPQVSPPSQLTQSIIHQAKVYKSKKLPVSKIYSLPYIQYAAAAVVVVTMGIAFTLINSQNETNAPILEETTSLEAQQTGNMNLIKPMVGFGAEADEAEITPWVDRDNVIRFSDGYNTNISSSYATDQDALEASYNKLTRVDVTNQNISGAPDQIQYTGTTRN